MFKITNQLKFVGLICILLSGCYQSVNNGDIDLATKQCLIREAKLIKLTATAIDTVYYTCSDKRAVYVLQ